MEKNTVCIFHNVQILKGGKVVGIHGTRLYSPYKEIGVKSLVKAMNITKKIADSIDNIPSATDFAKVYSDRIDDPDTDTDTDSSGNERMKILRNRPSFLFVHPLLFTVFGGVTKVNTNNVLHRIVDLLTRPDDRRGALFESPMYSSSSRQLKMIS